MKDPIPRPHHFSFDEAYYRKYYGDSSTRVADAASCAALADFVFAYLGYLEVPIARVLDVGCGTGLWRAEVLRHRPAARYVGVEKSGWACRRYGWEPGCLTSYRAAEAFDLVICSDVLQYLDESEAEAAIRHLVQLTRAAVYLKILTREDWETNCDRTVTDGQVYLRPAAWYRQRLAGPFRACGGGVFLRKDLPVVLYELEAPG